MDVPTLPPSEPSKTAPARTRRTDAWTTLFLSRVAPWLGIYAALAFILVAVSASLGDDLFELDDNRFDRDNSGPGGGDD